MLPISDHELSNLEIENLYGALMREAVEAFVVDPEFIIQIAEEAGKRERHKKRRRKNAKTDT